MERTEILEKLKLILRDIEGHDDKVIDKCSEEDSLQNDLGLNSIGMLYVMIRIEEEFEVSFENTHMDDFKTVGQVIDFIAEEI